MSTNMNINYDYPDLNDKNNNNQDIKPPSSLNNQTKKTNPIPELMKEYQSMDIMQFINHPNIAVYRYIPDKPDGYKRKSRFNCFVCGGEGYKKQDDIMKVSNQSRKYCHPWCTEPFHFSKDSDILYNDSNVDLFKKPKFGNKDESYEHELYKKLPSSSININFDPNNKSLSFLDDSIYDEPSYEQKELSEEEPHMAPKTRRQKQKSSRKQRDVSPKPLDITSESNKPVTRSRHRLAKKEKKDISTVESRKPDLKQWFYKKVKKEQNLLNNQLVQFQNYLKSSPLQRKKLLNDLMEVNYDNLPISNEEYNEKVIFDDILKEFESNYPLNQKELFDSSLLSNMDQQLINFLAWQRINQLYAQQKLQYQLSNYHNEPNKPKTKILHQENDQNSFYYFGVNRDTLTTNQNMDNSEVNSESLSKIAFKQPIIIVPDNKITQTTPTVNNNDKNSINNDNVINISSVQQQNPPSQVFQYIEGKEFNGIPPNIPLMPLFNHPLINTQTHKSSNESSDTNKGVNLQQQKSPQNTISPILVPQNISSLSHKSTPSQIQPPKKLLKPIQPYPYHSYTPTSSLNVPIQIPPPPPPPMQYQQHIKYDVNERKRSLSDMNPSLSVDENSNKVVKSNDNDFQTMAKYHSYNPIYELSANVTPLNSIAILRGKGNNEKTFYAWVTKEPFHIGRNADGLHLDLSRYTETKTISHLHATIVFKEEFNCFYLISKGRNGTRINGINYKPYEDDVERYIEVPITHGSIIEMGRIFMIFEILR